MEPRALAKLPSQILRLADLPNRRPTGFALTPGGDELAAVAEALELRDIRKLRFEGEIAPQGRSDWALTAQLGATVVQDCVITLAPVTTRIDEEVRRIYAADLPEPDGVEIEMPEDDTIEPLPATIDLGDVMLEALSLALPAFPRAEGAELEQSQFAAPGQKPMTDEDAKPFAGLAALRDSLENKGEEEPD